MNKDDSNIIKQIINRNDRKVIDNLYRDVFPNVRNYITKNNGALEEAQDCFQEAITKFYQQVLNGEFDYKYKIHGYIYSISIRLWLNLIKREKRKISLEDIDDNYLNIPLEENRDEILSEKNSIIKKILSKVGEKCKELLYHTVFTDLVNEDIMLRYQYPSIEAVRMQHKRCKLRLIALLEEEPELEEYLRA